MNRPSETHDNFGEHSQVHTPSNRSFGIVFTLVFLLIGLWPILRGAYQPHWWVVGIAVALFLVSFSRPELLAPFNRLWATFGLLLHRIVNPIIMGILFFLTILPIGLIMRLSGKDFLQLKLDSSAKSYWISRQPPGPEAESMRNQF